MQTQDTPTPHAVVVSLALGSLAQVLAASRSLWRAIEVADDHGVEAPSARYLNDSHEALLRVLRGAGGDDGLLALVDARLVPGWPDEARPHASLGVGDTLYVLADEQGTPRYGSPAMASAGHSLWFADAALAVGLASAMAREKDPRPPSAD